MHVLLDTGPWVAFIDRNEGRHNDCVKWLEGFQGEIFSTEAVLTEVLYLLNFSSSAQASAIDFVLEGAVVIVPPSIDSLKMAKNLIIKYSDTPMDYADATLVALAEDLGINHIVTFDKKDFGIYRIGRNRPFIIVP